MLFKGPEARRCTQKAEHTKGGLRAPHESCYLRGYGQGGAHTRRNAQKAGLTRSRGGPATGRCGTRASEQAGKALRSQGHQCAHVM